MKYIRTSILFIIGLFCSSFIIPVQQKTNVFLVGDSTVCLYPSSRAPLTGWGMPFADYFDTSVVVSNFAKGGRSTKTFLAENLWKPVIDSLRAGDYVLIQFGHNDEAKQPEFAARYTPANDYRKNLTRMITDVRSKGGIPILITPVSRMRFDKNGDALETHLEYTAAAIEVGRQSQTPVINLDEKSRALFQKLGPEITAQLFMTLDALEHPNYPQGSHDNTHFNEYGARRIAELVLRDLQEKHIGLSDRMLKGRIN
ncbi:rhamnogalacturonan acetylesterase [Pedobacter jeongneungensis]|uniref:rhamnogalacturonan acetylesterase n=1 Tax=Pedobacter jeongneungensis TaxID=947309 RepID=UPI0004A7993B|nr:rhamnogalacturonan acetylesterase [Pedobacter jeongneungensis]